MTNEQKRLLKAMRSTHIKASLILCGVAAVCVGIASQSSGLFWVILVLAVPFAASAVVFSVSRYKKSADIIKNAAAEKCVVEIFFIVKREDGGYEYTPVVRAPGGEFLMTFGDYDKSMYVKIPVKKREDWGKLQIQRSDRSVVNVGDTVLVYIKGYPNCKLDPQANLDKDIDDYDLKASVMKEAKVFEGVIDIE
ncbi:MAG: hypothetical protein K2J80_06370 [Oscillospiraceae bacterium]|nr:hypothetical protein [Oscillospiraceae bacterium]